jgi:hypothetical protein
MFLITTSCVFLEVEIEVARMLAKSQNATGNSATDQLDQEFSWFSSVLDQMLV